MVSSNKAKLSTGVASMAVAFTLAQPGVAEAACAPSASTVTCDSAGNTVTGVNTAVSSITPPNVSLVLSAGSTVTGPGTITVDSLFNGAVSFSNSGTVGTDLDNVNFDYSTDHTTPTSSFVGVNDISGIINGSYYVDGVGSANVNNAGVITGNGGFYGLTVYSDVSDTVTNGDITTYTYGGSATVVNSGTIGTPAVGMTPYSPAGTYIYSYGDASLLNSGTMGYTYVRAGSSTEEYQPTTVTVVSPTTTTTSRLDNYSPNAATASLNITSTGSATDVEMYNYGTGQTNATVDGAITSGNLYIYANGEDEESAYLASQITDGTLSDFSETTTEADANLTGLVNVAIGATGSVSGAVDISGGAGGVTATIAGHVGTGPGTGDVTIDADVSDSSYVETHTTHSDTGVSVETYASDYTETATGGAVAVDFASTAQISGDVDIRGNASASLTNGGLIGGDVDVIADGGTTHRVNFGNTDSQTVTTALDGTVTTVVADTQSETFTPSASPASFTNAAGALVEGDVNVSGGTGGATLVNNGTIRQDIDLTSSVSDTSSSSQTNSTTVVTTIPTTTTNYSASATSTSTAVGGAVSGTYAGTVGAFADGIDPGYAASVDQESDLSSTATISGTIVGDFYGYAGGGTSTYSTTQTYTLFNDGLNDSTSNTSAVSDFVNHATTSSATITGRVADLDGNGYGNVEVYSGGGAASLAITGGIVDGDVSVGAGANDQHSESHQTIVVVDSVPVSIHSDGSSNYSRVAADSTFTMTGGTVGEDADVYATRDATATVDLTSRIGDDLEVRAVGDSYFNLSTSDYTSTGPTTVATSSYSGSPKSGNALANVAGMIGGEAYVYSSAGNATLNLTGRVLQGLDVEASGGTYSSNQVTTTGPSSTQFASVYSTKASGGTAAIDIQSSDTMKTSLIPAVSEGDIFARGFTGASMKIGAGSLVFTDASISPGSTITVSSAFEDRDEKYYSDTTGGGTIHRDLKTTATGGTATFNNAGTVGFATQSILDGYYDAPIDVDLESTKVADFTNSGTLYGDVYIKSLGGTYSDVSDYTGVSPGEVETARTRTWTKGGGTLAFTNSGLIGGDLDLTSETATVTNSGVIRGLVKLGSSQQNYTVEGPSTGTGTIVALGAPLTQTYTFNQKGFLAGASDTLFDNLNGPTAIAITGAIEDNDDEFTSAPFAVDPSIAPASGPFISNNIVATINLDAGSVTIGNIVAEHDADTGARYTKSALNLNGNGYLGLSGVDDFRLKETIGTLAAFSAKDPLLTSANLGEAATAVGAFTLGSRVLGLDTVTKTGTGVFVINGATYIDAAPTPAWTMDVGTFAIQGGEAQLDVSPFTYDAIADEFTSTATPEFAIRGNVVNDASLVIGRRLPGDSANPLSSSVVDGIEVYIKGNLTQSATGTLVMGAATQTVGTGSVSDTSFVTSQALPVGTVTSQAVASTAFSTQALGQVLPVSYATTVFSSPSHITVDGDLTLAGKIDIATGPTAIYLNGTRTDLFDVSGAVNINVKTLTNGVDSPFLDFNYDTRPAGDGTTIVGVQVQRNSYTTQAADLNVVHMGTVLDGLLPRVVQQLTDGTFSSAQDRANVEDFATVLAMLDTQLDEGEIADAMQELTSGEFYGSLAATRTTDPFGDFTRNLPRNTGEKALNLWINPAGSFLRQGRYSVYGASATRTNNYGGSIGIGGTSASGFSYGIGFGYGDIDQDARGTPEHANADTYMVGIFAQVPLSQINLGIQAVYGWSNWNTSRAMPTFGRTATAKFDSNEFRVIAEASHNFELGKVDIVPFLRGDLRHYSFDGFTEAGGGSIGLIVDKKSKTLFSPEVGAKIVGNYGSGNAKIHPEASVSYTLQGDVGGNRDVAFLVDPASKFRLQGTDPDAFWTFGAGLSAQIGSKSAAYLRGAFASGGDQHGASFSAGVKIGF